MSTDATRIADITQYGTILWSGIFQMTLAFFSLYQLLGWQMLIGVAVMVLSFPINAIIARLQTRMQKRQMKNKDQRTRLMNEILNNIKSIKLYSE
jgi:ATP-binding cassette subfamily C (CFTR/MRP) protein 1